MTKRIQRKRTAGWRLPEGAVIITRPSKWGNPFRVVKEDGTWHVKDPQDNYYGDGFYEDRADAVTKALECHRGYVDGKIGLGELDLNELKDKDLCCFCEEGTPCHGDYLLELLKN